MSQRHISRVFVASILAAGLGICSAASAANIGFHWSDYYVTDPHPVSGTDGVVPNSHWTNVEAGYGTVGTANNTNLVDSDGNVTTASATSTAAGGGTYWWAYYQYITPPAGGSFEPLLTGPSGGSGAIPTVISNIPYTNYDIILYVNQPYDGNYQAWNGSDPTTVYHFSPTINTSNSFVPITNTDVTNIDPNSLSYPRGNYIDFTGLTGSSQTLWVANNDGGGTAGSGGFQIVDTTPIPEPASLTLLGLGGLLMFRRRR